MDCDIYESSVDVLNFINHIFTLGLFWFSMIGLEIKGFPILVCKEQC